MEAQKNFLLGKIDKQELQQIMGGDLYHVKDVHPMAVTAKHVINILKKYLKNEMSSSELVDWTNVVWFTDLYEYDDGSSDSITSVLNYLEEIDEEDVNYSDEDIKRMIVALEENAEFDM